MSGNGAVTAVATAAGSTTDLYRTREWGASYVPQLVVTTSATPAATVAPSVPSGLKATPGDGVVALSWSASTDDVGVTGYRVYRDGVLAGSPPRPR